MIKNIKTLGGGLFTWPEGSPESGRLVGAKCGGCGAVSFPKRQVCPQCLRDDAMTEVALSRRGILYSFSINRMAPEGFTAPYIIGKVDLPEKVRVFAIITGVATEESALAIGQEMELDFGPVSRNAAGEELIGYVFRPVIEPVTGKE